MKQHTINPDSTMMKLFRFDHDMASLVRDRGGKIVVLLVVFIPAIFGMLALVLDGSRLMTESAIIQQAADAGAIAAAASLNRGQSSAIAGQRATDSVRNRNGLSAADVQVSIPPVHGSYAGKSGFAEVRVSLQIPMSFASAINRQSDQSISATAIAGLDDATAGAAIVVLDPHPPGIALPAIAGISLPSLPALNLGGMEVLGLGNLKVDGAVLVNNEWGGVDEEGQPAGEAMLLRRAMTCMPILPLTKLKARDIRVVGGVDDEDNYGNYVSGKKSGLKANARPVPDPLSSLPVPTLAADPTRVSATLRGGKIVVGLPLIGPPVVLHPGVYDYIQVVSGIAIFQPGVYIIRGKNPLTQIPLQIIAGQFTADGVMFYITDSASYSPSSGLPDAADGETEPAAPSLGTVLPSAVINVGLLGSRWTPISDPSSPYNGVCLFQRRADRRIIVLSRDTLLADGSYSGTVYAKWGHLIFADMGTVNARFVVGSIRFVNIFDTTVQPTSLLPPARDVFLVQ